ncbi:unnamed protein product [Tetraodon nigroviridis]|uniref:(spotted green pufferfish) hypothetical protein n=1 Tax=Tetraodon nigroviridis TaxID=99883 RepID=Q4SBB2_TETNG|nr:unnamed protein product [Tetraodon nigroviridis]
MSRMRVACVLGVFLVLLQLSHPLLLGAFNIQCFGNKKASDVPVMDIISQIVHRYDIILIQEVRDSDMSATKKLMERVNRGSPAFTYSYIVSEPLGSSTYKERYLFLYREASVSVAKNYTYDDGCEPCGTDTFSREPFVVMFSSKQAAVGNFVLIPQHTRPGSAVKEIDALYDVVADVYRRWNTKDILLLGDFNAGGSYVTQYDWQCIRLFTDKSFHWLITNDVYTMVKGTPSSFDRIVVTTDMMRRVKPGSAAVYNYKTHLGLTQEWLSHPLLLGAFNIKSFGDKKASNETLMDIISQIVHRYDIILIQEVRDSDLSATKKLMECVNRGSPLFRYNYIDSEPLGRSPYKERYLFLYRKASVSVAGSYTYDDTPRKFSREPFVVMFSPKQPAVGNFVLIPQHTSPSSAVKEIDALYDVVADVGRRWNTKDILLLGDFNAGCSYVTGSDWQKIRLFTNKSFHWLITDAADTTVSPRRTAPTTDTDPSQAGLLCLCRIVVTTDMMRRVKLGSAAVYDFKTHLGLTQEWIVHRYDIILIQEVRDSDLSATKKLMELVNSGSPAFTYSYIVSEPLGPSTYKETYLFLYRDASVSVAGSYTYTNIPRKFSREPFVVMFSPKQTAVGNFVLIPQHTSPSSAVEEIDALYDVVDDVYRRWKTKDILLLGDFNAGCNYVTGSDWQKIRLFTDKSFHWLITNDVYTMVTGTPSSYDRMRVACVLGVFLVLLQLSHPLLLGAFNIKSFGDKKASNETLMDIISQIVHRYDIILIQEVRDSDLSATKKLMERVNRGSPLYSHIVSEPLGRSTYKERYLFLYREASVSVAKNYTYDDGCEPCGTDTFSREPFVVMFSSKQAAVGNFVLIPQHTSPSSAVEEIDALYDVVADVGRRWNTKDILLLGDFNAGCNYVTGSDWQKIRLFTDKSFHWLITDDVDTMV